MNQPSRVLYSEFLRQVRDGNVDQASVSPTEIRYTLKTSPDQDAALSTSDAAKAPKFYTTVPVESDLDLVKLLEEQGVEFGAPPPSSGGFLTNLMG